jgi:hypothetical protein
MQINWGHLRQQISRTAKVVGDFQAKLLLTLLYLLVALPTGLVVRFGEDALSLRRPPQRSFWQARPLTDPTMRSARRQG